MCNKAFLTVGKNNSSLILRLTKQIKYLGLKDGDQVYTYTVNKDGKKIIVVEGVEK